MPAALLPAPTPGWCRAAGGLAAMLPPDPSPSAAAAAVARLDGLVVAGGPDVEPVRYGRGPTRVRDLRTGRGTPGSWP